LHKIAKLLQNNKISKCFT